MTSRQPKWTGPKTHGVRAMLAGDGWPGHIWGTYRHKSHAKQAQRDLSAFYQGLDFEVVPLVQDDTRPGGWRTLRPAVRHRKVNRKN